MKTMKQSLTDPVTPVIVFLVVAVVQILCNFIPQIVPVQYYVACAVAFVATLAVWVFGLKKEGNFWDLVWAVLLALPINAFGSYALQYLTK